MIVYLLRHGQTLLNASGRLRGHDAVNRALLGTLVPELGRDPGRIPQRTGCWNKRVRERGAWHIPILDARPGDGHHP